MQVDLEARYQALFETTLDGIVIVDDTGRYVDVNPSLCRLLKGTREQLVGAHFSQFIPTERLDEARTDFGDLKSIGSFEGEFPMRALDGSVVELEWTSRASFLPGLHFCVARDITARKQAERELARAQQELTDRLSRDIAERERTAEAQQFLAQASDLLSSSLDYEMTLRHVARLVVPRLADWCTVHFLEAGGGVRQVAVEHADPEKSRWARELGERYPVDPDEPGGLAHVLRTGEPALYPEIPDELLVAAARDAAHLEVLHRVGFSSVMIVPMCARGRVLGAITFVAAESSVRYGPPDLQLAEELARRSGIAVDNASLYQEARRSLGALRQSEARLRVAYGLSQAVGRAAGVEEVYEAALDALTGALGTERAAVLLFDAAGVMRFVGWRGLSDRYRAAVEGHSPWSPGDPDPGPLVVKDVAADSSLAPFHEPFRSEGIAALAFIPLLFERRLLGKFMLYFPQPRALEEEELRLAQTIANQIAFAIERRRAEEAVRTSEREFRTIFELAGSGKAEAVPPTWRFTRVNRRLCEMLGYTEAEMLERTPTDVTHPDDQPRDRELAAALARGEQEEWQHEKRYVRKDGEAIWVIVTGRLLRDDDGRPLRAISTVHDITARKQAEEALREADRRKDDFLAMLAHELRNPLGPVRNALHLLRLQGDDPGRVARLREMLERQVGHMTRIIDDLLDVSRITRGKITLSRERLDLRQVVRTAVDDHRPALEAAGLTVKLQLPDHPAWVYGDPTRLTQVVDNLLENAGKFTDRGGSVTVAVGSGQWAVGREVKDASAAGHLPELPTAHSPLPTVLLSVRDTGMGIEPELLPQLFGIFTQADRTLDRSRGGLGLALIRGLVELHGGTVSAHSEGVGQGAEFVILLPGVAEPPALAELPAPPEPCAAGYSVLIVEDNPDAAESLRMLLEAYGCEVMTAHTGAAALAAARARAPAVILCDIGLPEMDGYAVARALRADPRTAGSRLIALTGYGRQEDIELAREAGFDAHLTKPAPPEKLLGLIEPTAVPV